MNQNEIQEQIDALQKQLSALKKAERDDALANVRSLVRIHALTQDDVFESTKQNHKPAKKVLAKYRDPVSGATWTGRGITPRWILGLDREQFLIDETKKVNV